MMIDSRDIIQKIGKDKHIWLLLDYDGTLADFAPTPDDVIPDPALIDLVRKLANQPRISLAIISGRRLSHIEKLMPVNGIWLAGSYGLELHTPEGEYIYRSDYDIIRPALENLKSSWVNLIDDQDGFYLEDKGWSLALHARYAEDNFAEQILSEARSIAKKNVLEDKFLVLGGQKFLEIAPENADKGKTVAFLLRNENERNFIPIYLGDDDKDEKAFPVVKSKQGLTGCVCGEERSTSADFLLRSPKETRSWLFHLLNSL